MVVRLEDWESRHVNPEGEIIEVLGPATAPGVDMLSIIRKYHLPTEFPSDVLAQAEGIPETVEPQQIAGREDLREQFIVTIDPDDARDFDDAINVEKLADGGWQLGVHIADVAAYVAPGSALDREALQARQQCLSARSRDPDVAGAVEQRGLQPEARRRSADAFRLYPVRQTWRSEKRALCTDRDSKCAPAHLQARPTRFCKVAARRPVGRTSARRLGARRVSAARNASSTARSILISRK